MDARGWWNRSAARSVACGANLVVASMSADVRAMTSHTASMAGGAMVIGWCGTSGLHITAVGNAEIVHVTTGQKERPIVKSSKVKKSPKLAPSLSPSSATMTSPSIVHDQQARCLHTHHETFGQILVCPKCKGPMACGPSNHACKACQPDDFRNCLMCHQPRVFCCC